MFLGPIPARAGEPMSITLITGVPGAYPRSRGGTPFAGRVLERVAGLSPLARGNPITETVDGAIQGPIPARAGEPLHDLVTLDAMRAYPRSRGGTMF